VVESQFEERLYNERREKLKQIAALGQRAGLSFAEATYPNSYAATITIPELRAKFDSLTAENFEADLAAGHRIEVSIAGRIMAIRVQGKAGFAQLQQASQRMQLYVRRDDVGEDGFALYKLLDLGDHVGARGFLFRTRTGELTVHVTALTFLAKAMLALPDKFHGLEDTELRYRQRYLDLIVNTEYSAQQARAVAKYAQDPAIRLLGEPPTENQYEGPGDVRGIFVKRAKILRSMRTFFDARGYLEVETPMMHTIAGGAAALPFITHHNALDIELKLRIAPELFLKRLVIGGFDRVYEINRNFRNEGISTQHNPEFTMLEFYQAYSNYEHLMDLTEELVKFVAIEVNGSLLANFNGVEIDLSKWRRLRMVDAIIEFWDHEAGLPPSMGDLASVSQFLKFVDRLRDLYNRKRTLMDEQDEMKRETSEFRAEYSLYVLSEKLMQRISEGLKDGTMLLGTAIFYVFELLAEEHLIQPTIIYDFPLAVSPLSKIKPGEPDWVERFEFYIGGFEIGNAFSELNDADDQRRRFEAQIEERKRGDEEAMAEVDEDYVRALGYGLPPTAGEGIGIDRLTMVLTGSKSIRDVILFPLLRPVGSKNEAQG
jgi:lysyl-tRNA synthetase class 2